MPAASGRPRGAFHLAVEVAVPQVVHHAARGAHGDGAERRTAPSASSPSAQPGAARAKAQKPGQHQQPGADRPVEARQQRIGPPAGGQPRDPAAGADVGVAAHGRYTCPWRSRHVHPAPVPRRPLAAGADGRGHARPGASPRHRDAARRRRCRCGCSTRATGNGRRSIAAIRKDRATLRVDRPHPPAGGRSPTLRLLVAALKRDAMDWVVEKATELGVSLIQPVITAAHRR